MAQKMPIKTANESETAMKEMLTQSDIVAKKLLSDEFLHKLEDSRKRES